MKLNLGSGPNLFKPPWVNVDRDSVEDTYLKHLRSASNVDGWPEWQREQWEFLRGGKSFELRQSDITKGEWHWRIFGKKYGLSDWKFRVANGMEPAFECDAIYLGQVVEHLNPIHQLPGLLSECHAAIKPGGILRITTPDFAKILDAYNRNDMQRFASEQPAFYAEADALTQMSYLLFGATGPDCTQQNYEGHFHVWHPESLTKELAKAGFTGFDYSWPSKRLTDVRDFGESHSFAVECVK